MTARKSLWKICIRRCSNKSKNLLTYFVNVLRKYPGKQEEQLEADVSQVMQ